MASSTAAVAVWEWLNEYGRWRPYDPHVCDYIEKNVGRHVQGPIYLGHADSVLFNYSIDLTSMQQIRHSTGTQRTVRRKLYTASSPAGSGISWQWSGDQVGQWHQYDMDSACVLEDAFSQGYPSIDLSKTECKVPYTIDLTNMRQLRNETGFARSIQRIQTNLHYPLANSNSNMLSSTIGANSNRISDIDTSNTRTSLSTNPLCSVNSNMCSSTSGMLVGGASGSAFNPGHSSTAASLYGYSSNSHPQKSGAVTKKKGHSSQVFNGSPSKFTRLAVRSLAAANQQHLQHQNLQQHLQHQQQQPNPPPTVLSGGSHGINYNNLYASFTPGFSSGLGTQRGGFNPNMPHSNALPPQTITAGTSRTLGALLSPAMTSMTNMLVSPAVPVMITSPPSSGTTPFGFGIITDDHSSTGAVQADEVLKKYVYIVSNPPSDDDCSICFDKLTESSDYNSEGPDYTVYKLNRCNHSYHRSCLCAMYNSGTKDGSIQCPTCKTIYGKKHGNRPQGHMQYATLSQSLPGHADCRTIRVDYTIPPGIQGPGHPNPGKPYAARGFPRHGYLPDSERGRKLLRLLIIAWERRLTFTIGTSVTTGERDTVVWNEIHHKTEFGSNHSGHGYPDPKYMDNLTMELAAQGVKEEDL